MDKFFFALIGFPLSFLIIIYRFKIKQFTGDIPFAETWLGAGGTYTLIIIIGFFTFVATLLYVTGTVQSFLYTVFGPLFLVK